MPRNRDLQGQSIRQALSDSESNLGSGKTTTRKITRGPNKGDVVKDVGKKSTLRNNPGVKFGKKK